MLVQNSLGHHLDKELGLEWSCCGYTNGDAYLHKGFSLIIFLGFLMGFYTLNVSFGQLLSPKLRSGPKVVGPWSTKVYYFIGNSSWWSNQNSLM